jgi:16S rRNA processing protein RimM
LPNGPVVLDAPIPVSALTRLNAPNLSGVPILMGVIGRAHGVRGLVRVTSYTADPAALTGYGPLSDASGRIFTLCWMADGIAEVFEIVDGEPVKIADRSAAERLTNMKLFIERDRMPAPDADEYYLADLIGLAAVGADDAPVGVVSAVHDYGAGVSLEVAREHAGSLLIPFTAACVPEVDIAAGRVMVVPPDEIDVPDAASRLSHSPAENRDSPASNRHPPACPGDTARNGARSDPGASHEDDGDARVLNKNRHTDLDDDAAEAAA